MKAAADAVKTTAQQLTIVVKKIAHKVLYAPARIRKADFCSGPKLVSVFCSASASIEKHTEGFGLSCMMTIVASAVFSGGRLCGKSLRGGLYWLWCR
jgi:hypothetical protein